MNSLHQNLYTGCQVLQTYFYKLITLPYSKILLQLWEWIPRSKTRCFKIVLPTLGLRVLNTTSLKCCLLLTDGRNSCMCIKVQDHLMQVHFIEIHLVFNRKNVRCFSEGFFRIYILHLFSNLRLILNLIN